MWSPRCGRVTRGSGAGVALVALPFVVTTAVVAAARDRGVLLSAVGPRTVRAVTHLDVSLDDCVTAGRIVGELLGTP